jgi:hypothetical protein
MPYQYAQSLTGAPLASSRLYFYYSGTVTPLDTYSDQALTVPNTNPVEADQYGVFPTIFLQNQSYRVVHTEAPTATGGPGAEIWTADPVSPIVPTASDAPTFLVAELTVDGAGSTPGTGIAGDSYVPVDCTITAAVMQATSAGSAVVDVWAAPLVVNTPPTISNSIVASAPPTLVTAQSSIDTTLTGWSVSLTAGTALRFNLNSASTLTHFTLSLVATIP